QDSSADPEDSASAVVPPPSLFCHCSGLTLHASRVTAMDKYEIVAQVGEGAYGVVYHVKCRVTDQRYALKCHRNYENGTMTDSTVRELSCLSALRGHPNIVETLDCFLHDGEIATLMPYLPLTLFEVIYQGRYHSGLLPITFIGRFSLEIADALAYMHGLNMIHRDLTPANVLLTADTLTVKVADMGLSRYAAKSMSSGLVTESYRAPELFDTKKEGIAQYTCAIDMWSLGVLIVDAMEATMTFHSKNFPTYKIIKETLGRDDHEDESIWNPMCVMPTLMRCTEVKRIALALLQYDPKRRLTARTLLDDTFRCDRVPPTIEPQATPLDPVGQRRCSGTPTADPRRESQCRTRPFPHTRVARSQRVRPVHPARAAGSWHTDYRTSRC
uniref:Protein kinase domain-containing protein n=1 Tax=Maylandia zebra TaxID=106582 RepID=A0A3P9DAW2_9CICH